VQHVEQLIHVAWVQADARCHMSLPCSPRRVWYGAREARTHAWFPRPGTGSNRRLPGVRRRPRFGAPRERQREPCPVRAGGSDRCPDSISYSHRHCPVGHSVALVQPCAPTFCESSDTLIFFFFEGDWGSRPSTYLFD